MPFRVLRPRRCCSWTKVGPNASGKRVKGREFLTPSPSPNPRDVKGLNAVERSGRVALWAVTPSVWARPPSLLFVSRSPLGAVNRFARWQSVIGQPSAGIVALGTEYNGHQKLGPRACRTGGALPLVNYCRSPTVRGYWRPFSRRQHQRRAGP
jgi:hypothetical protein